MRHSTKPKKASGSRNAGSAELPWMAPNTMPVPTAAGDSPRTVRGVGGAAVDGAEHDARPDRGGPQPAPVAQRGEEVAAEEELLGHRRDHGDEERAGEQRRGAVVGPEPLGELVVVGAAG